MFESQLHLTWLHFPHYHYKEAYHFTTCLLLHYDVMKTESLKVPTHLSPSLCTTQHIPNYNLWFYNLQYRQRVPLLRVSPWTSVVLCEYLSQLVEIFSFIAHQNKNHSIIAGSCLASLWFIASIVVIPFRKNM